MVRKTAQEKLDSLYPQTTRAGSEELDPRYTPKTVKQAVNHIAGAKKPPKEARATWAQRCALSEKIKPLYTKPITPVPATADGSKWSPERDEHLFAFLMQGGIIRVWLDLAGLTYSDIHRRKQKDPTFAAKYDEARSLGMDALADEALLIASSPMETEEVAETTLADGGKVVVRKKGDNTYARKLAFYSRVELLKKWAPERYGEKISVDVTDKRAAAILAARRKLQGLD